MRPLVDGGQTLHLFAGYGGKTSARSRLAAHETEQPQLLGDTEARKEEPQRQRRDDDDRGDTVGEVRLVRTAARGRATGNGG